MSLHDLRRCRGRGRASIKHARRRRARCRRGTSTRPSASSTFKDDPSLSDEEIATIVKWVDAGAPRGNPADMPPPRQFADSSKWQIGTARHRHQVSRRTRSRRPGPILFGNLYADIPIDQDRYIKAIQTRAATAASRKVVHHALSFAVDDPNARRERRRQHGRRTADSSSSSTHRARTPRCTRTTSGVLLQARQEGAWSATTCTRSAKRPNAEIELGIVLYPKAYVPKHIRWSKQLAQPTAAARHPGRNGRAHRRLHRRCTSRRASSRSSRTCTSAASGSVSS